ncbi:hypothetical protein [Legionella gratiana]|nr:hypothetical protein [Legionella gratiana]
MKLNILYGVLRLLTESSEFKLCDKIIPIHDRTLEDKEYYRLEIPHEDIAAEGLKLQEIHMSIYKKVDPQNAALGPSHFTALFHNSYGQEFRMHLFLNCFDTLACPPTWELLDGEHHYVKVDPPACMDYLTHAIWQQGLPCLQELRRQQKTIETRLLSDYNELEQQTALLYEKLDENKLAYLESLQKLINSATLLTKISDSPNWPRVISYLRKLHNSTSSMPERSIESIDKKETLKQDKKEEKISITSSKQSTCKNHRHPINTSLSQHTLFSKPSMDSSPVTAIQKRVNKIENLFDKMSKTADNHLKALLLIDLNRQLVDIDLENLTSLTSTQINTLSQIEIKVAHQAKSMLQMVLLKGEYDFARTLSPFYNLINSDILAIALMQKNADLLRFAVKELALPINSYPITMKKQTYPNVVQYCFSECQGKDSLLDCFSVLIEQGASLMDPVGPDKLPLAHLILSAKPKHPLYAALEQNKNLTLNNQHFYAHLIYVLKGHIRADILEKEKKAELEAWIGRYEQLKIRSESQNLLLNPKNQILSEEISAIAKKFFSTAMVEALERDEDIARENAYLAQETKELLQMIKLFQRKTGKVFPYQSLMNASNQDLKKELLKSDLQVDIGFSELKSSIMQNLNNGRLMISYCKELIEVLTMMTQLPPIAGKKNKRFRALDGQRKELMSKIEELNKTMPYSIIKNYNDVQESLNQLEDLMGKFTDLKGGLTMLTELLNQLKVEVPSHAGSSSFAVEDESAEEKRSECPLQ